MWRPFLPFLPQTKCGTCNRFWLKAHSPTSKENPPTCWLISCEVKRVVYHYNTFLPQTKCGTCNWFWLRAQSPASKENPPTCCLISCEIKGVASITSATLGLRPKMAKMVSTLIILILILIERERKSKNFGRLNFLHS